MKTKHLFILALLFIGVSSFFSPTFTANAQNNTGTIYILKNQEFTTLGRPIFMINDMQIGQLPKKAYYECTVPEGNLTVSVFYNNEQKDISIQVKSGGHYYVCADIKSFSTGGGRVASFASSGAANFGFGRQQTQARSGGMVNTGNISYSVNLTRLNDTQGEEMIQKCKTQLFADLSDLEVLPATISNDDAYAQQSPIQVSTPVKEIKEKSSKEKSILTSDVDINIPLTNIENKNTFVLIVANEDYEFVDDVEFAINDGKSFREYCIKTLGVPERQVWLYENASLGIISSGVNKMVQAMNIFNDAKAIIYYCGHGIPDEKTGDAYIIPVDGQGTDVSSCYSLNKLYKTMASAKTANVTYFMDACFTGANRDGSMLVAARGVAREPKKEVITGNAVVFSAASGDETAMPFKEKGHGMFTYFLLKKLQDTKGDVTYGELAEYINENVKKEAFFTNNKPQNPVVATSKEFTASWQNIKMR